MSASSGAALPSAPTGAGRAGTFEPTAGDGARSSEDLGWRASRACPAGLAEAMGPSFARVPAVAAPANSGGAGEGAPAAADPDASLADASARVPGSGEERRFESDGEPALGAADRRPAPSRTKAVASERALRAAFSDASAASEATARALFGTLRGAHRAEFPTVSHPLQACSESCPIK